MLQAAREFKVGRPQIFAGLMLLAFITQCQWASRSRPLSELEKVYIACGLGREKPEPGTTSPLTSWTAALPVRAMLSAGTVSSARFSSVLSVSRPWVIRVPFIIFGVWLGGALWWVARRLFGNRGGYVALALYCSSPAMVMASSNIGPEIILAWSIFGVIYTAIGVAHTLYAPARKWAPRIVILGLAIGFAISTTLWSTVAVALALAFMMYLAPGRRSAVFVVLLGASAIAVAVLGFFSWATATPLMGGWVAPRSSMDLLYRLNFVFADDYALVVFFIASLTAYGSWTRARYFGNTAPLLTAVAMVVVFALTPSLRLWSAPIGLCFAFVFIGGVVADLLETALAPSLAFILTAGFLMRIVLGVRTLWVYWVVRNQA
jgi:hypothetical protein